MPPPTRLLPTRLLPIIVLVTAILLPPAAHAEPHLQEMAFAPGAVVNIAGTPHIFIADERGVLHWGGDTRALAGKTVDWGNRIELSAAVVRTVERGDPWLSTSLVKIGDPIYLAKWETAEARPRLLHIQSIADVELFGIGATNYGNFVMDRAAWEARFSFNTDQLSRSELPSGVAQPLPTGATLLTDSFDDPSTGVLSKTSSRPELTVYGYAAGEFFLRDVNPPDAGSRGPVLPGMYGDASLAVDVRFVPDAQSGYFQIECRREAAATVNGYLTRFDARNGRFKLARGDSSREVVLQDWQTSAAIRRGTETNRVELTCTGTTIALTINGIQVGAVEDATYRTGRFWIGVSSYTNAPEHTEVRLDNLAISQR